MQETLYHQLDNFFVAGIGYRNTDAHNRGKFSLTESQYKSLLEDAQSHGYKDLFVLSTCNRTEIYGVGLSPQLWIDLLCRHTAGSKSLFLRSAYLKRGVECIGHLFKVASGLDSQVMGDYEIVNQLKRAFHFARSRGMAGGFLERVVGSALKCSKKIRTNTGLSSGPLSVSYSSVKYVYNHPQFSNSTHFLVIGAGKVGRELCVNLLKSFPGAEITLLNRGWEKGEKFAEEFQIHHASNTNKAGCVNAAEVIFLATNSEVPILDRKDFLGFTRKLVIDLSIPSNVAPDVEILPHITLVSLDQISREINESQKSRERELPKAILILQGQMDEFQKWLEFTRHGTKLSLLKRKLREMSTSVGLISGYFLNEDWLRTQNEMIDNIMGRSAQQLRQQDFPGCLLIVVLGKFMQDLVSLTEWSSTPRLGNPA